MKDEYPRFKVTVVPVPKQPELLHLIFRRAYDPNCAESHVERLTDDELRIVRNVIDAYFASKEDL